VEGREIIAVGPEQSLVEAIATAVEKPKQHEKMNTLLHQNKKNDFFEAIHREDVKEIDRNMNLIKWVAVLAKGRNDELFALVCDGKNWGLCLAA